MNNIDKYKIIINKLIKPIQGIDLLDEYIKIRLKISKLSSNQRKAVMTHILINYNQSEDVREIIDKIDQMIIDEIKKSNGISVLQQ